MDIVQKTRDDYNAIAAAFSDTRQHAGELTQFRPFLANGQYILDWGCGNGRLLYLLKDHDVHYSGVDQSQGLLKEAKKNPLIEFQDAKFFCTAHKDKKFEANYFDLVFMIASFHHLPDDKSRLKLLKKILKEMKPGAHLIMTNWNLESDWAATKLKKDWKKLAPNDYLIPWKSKDGTVVVERYYHHFTPEALETLVKKAGFEIVKICYSSGAGETKKKDGKNLVCIATKPKKRHSVDNFVDPS
jgi:SAM-dependent methyltransferase